MSTIYDTEAAINKAVADRQRSAVVRRGDGKAGNRGMTRQDQLSLVNLGIIVVSCAESGL